jgi:hypothetical protein
MTDRECSYFTKDIRTDAVLTVIEQYREIQQLMYFSPYTYLSSPAYFLYLRGIQ